MIFVRIIFTYETCYFFFSNDGKQFAGSIYQKVNPQLDTGVELSWSSENNDTKFGLASKFTLDKETYVKAKVNNSSEIGLCYSQKIRDGKFADKKIVSSYF